MCKAGVARNNAPPNRRHRRVGMKKLAKALLTLTLGAGIALSAAALSACGSSKEMLIDGDFSTQATEVQLTTLRGYVSDFNSDDLLGDTEAGGWRYNARYNASGSISASMNVSMEGQTAGMDLDTDVNYDHTISMANVDSGVSVRGSGNMSYGFNLSMSSPGEEDYRISAELDGSSYNDEDYFYLNGSVNLNDNGSGQIQSTKVKFDLDMLFGNIFQTGSTSSGMIVDISPALDALEAAGAAVYVDESSSFKVKISLSSQGWAEMYAEAIEDFAGMVGSDIDLNVIANNTDFGHCDIYLDFNKDTGVLLGYGSSVDAEFGYSATVSGASVSVTYDMDIDSWFVSTDEEAGQLPSDLGEYQYAVM